MHAVFRMVGTSVPEIIFSNDKLHIIFQLKNLEFREHSNFLIIDFNFFLIRKKLLSDSKYKKKLNLHSQLFILVCFHRYLKHARKTTIKAGFLVICLSRYIRTSASKHAKKARIFSSLVVRYKL